MSNPTVTIENQEVEITPLMAAKIIWSMNSDEQAQMFGHLYHEADGSHNLMMQFMMVRDECMERRKANYHDKSMEAFMCLTVSAFKYASEVVV